MNCQNCGTPMTNETSDKELVTVSHLCPNCGKQENLTFANGNDFNPFEKKDKPVNLKTELASLRPLDRWKLAGTAFLQIIDFVKHSPADIGDKMQLVACFAAFYDFAASFNHQLKEALELAKLLEKFPQFDISTPRYSIGGKTFFMELLPVLYSIEYGKRQNEYIKAAHYVDSDTGNYYPLVGKTWEENERVYCAAYLNGETVYEANFTMHSTHRNMGQISGSASVISSAFNAAENALFAQLKLLPF